MPLTLSIKNHQITYKRVLGHLIGEQNGPTVVFLCGIHGNEPAGVKAINQVFNKIVENKNHVHGHCYAIAGNLNALQKKVRFQDMDLNRIWTLNNVARILENGPNPNIHEEQELTELHAILFEILQKHPPPFYFIDLHTTSAESPPFLVVNDSLLNRRFVSHYPLPIVLGIEEYLEGALLSYMNELGFVAFGFEGGKHDSPEAVSNCENFVWSSLLLTGTIEKVDGHKISWRKNTNDPERENVFYEIYHRHWVEDGDLFTMKPGFINFQYVPKAQTLAEHGGRLIEAGENTRIFMPLYQKQGNDGFYFIREIPPFFLWASKILRRLKTDNLLLLLPGITRSKHRKGSLRVNLKTARFMAKQLFHLLGYRARHRNVDYLMVSSREAASKHKDYVHAKWYKKRFLKEQP